MLKWLIRRRLAAFERAHGYDASYMRDVLAADTGAFLRFARLTGISSYRKDVPLGLYYAVKLTATIAEDCGPCTQLSVTMALADGLPARTITSILEGAGMLPEVELGAKFARAALAHSPDADPLREEILHKWGPRALVSLAFALVSGRMFPTVKYALGHGKSCQRVVVEGTSVAVRSAA